MKHLIWVGILCIFVIHKLINDNLIIILILFELGMFDQFL